MKPRWIDEADFVTAIARGATITIRWRKASATHVVYVSGHVYESGFYESPDRKAQDLAERFGVPLERIKIDSFEH